MNHFNELNPAELERLAMIAEECAEVIQVVGKILRHGYESYHPKDESKTTNRELLEIELGHVDFATSQLVKSRDLNVTFINLSAENKRKSVSQYLHHATVL